MPEPPGKGSGDPRLLAWRVLRAVDAEDAYANLALAHHLREADLPARDAALSTELVGGTLRLRGLYDAVLATAAGRPVDRLDPPVLDVLRIGAHQLLSTRVPPHAAVSTSVALTRRAVGHRPAGLVNAVLRRVAGHDRCAWVEQAAPAYEVDPLGHLAVAESHPRWVVEQLHLALGADLGETRRLLAADNQAPAVTLVARPGLSTVDELSVQGAGPGRWSQYAVVLAGGDPGGLAAVREARAGVQDEGSQLVTLAAAEVAVTGRDTAWLDLAAGPGGKAALLAAIGAARGARLTAVERHPHRARLAEQAVRRTPGTRVVVADATAGAVPADSYDRVLLDAPCTGLGALRRRPEARWRRSADDLPALTALQRALVHAALTAARPGGVVTYATCSPALAETREVVETVLSERGDAELLDASAALPVVHDQGGPYVQLWPHRHGTDAMFVAQLRRR